MTEVYVFCRGGEPLSEEEAARLPRWRRERLESLRYPPARQESLCAGLLYAFALNRLGLSPHEPVSFLPAGKPVFAARNDLYFSLSHSGVYAVCAVSEKPIGADVQAVRPVKLSIARRLHPQERDWLSRQPQLEQTEAFFRLWTRKEAWVKAVSGPRTLSLSEADVIHRLPGWHFRDYALPEGFRAAVCAQETDIPLRPYMVEREELIP